MECIAALHHNKRKTNYHIHLIFSGKTACRIGGEDCYKKYVLMTKTESMYEQKRYWMKRDSFGKNVKSFPKGEVYERNIFTIKRTVGLRVIASSMK